MSTLIVDSAPVLRPVSALDLSSDIGVGTSVFRLKLNKSVLKDGNVVQLEYLITPDANLVTSGAVGVVNDFVCIDHVQGLPIPEHDMADDDIQTVLLNVPVSIAASNTPTTQHIRFRVYVGEELLIRVTDWSNAAPFKPPLLQPPTPRGFLIRNDEINYYNVTDQLYVQFPVSSLSVPYDLDDPDDQVKFIVSFNYTDLTGDVKWVISSPLTGHYYTDGSDVFSDRHILLEPITLPNIESVIWGQNVSPHVAVNAILEYEFVESKFYTISEISDTVVASDVTVDNIAPSISEIVYDHGTQTMTVSWKAGGVANIPNYQVTNYVVKVTDANTTETVELLGTDFSYTHQIDPDLLADGTDSTAITFVVEAVSIVGTVFPSEPSSKNTFTFAQAPKNLIVVWATSGSEDPSKVDMLITFNNPLSVGQGTPGSFILKVDGKEFNMDFTTTNTYEISLDEEELASTGTVELFLQTKDTNSENLLNGATSSTSYISVDVPIFISPPPTRSDDTLDFVLVSRIPIVAKNEIRTIDDHDDDSTNTHVSSSAELLVDVVVDEGTTTASKTYTNDVGSIQGSYTVELVVDPTGVHEYRFAVTKQWLSNAGLNMDHTLKIIVANQTGITSRFLSRV